MFQQKNTSPRLLLICLTLALSLAFSSMALAGKLKEYSAEQFLIQKGKEQMTGKIYISPERMRMEQTMPDMPEEMFIIIRQDKKLTWTVFPKKKKYVESALTEEDMKNPAGFSGPGSMKVKTREEKLGFETINGYKCEKKRIVSTMQMMGREMTSRSTAWISEELGFPMRTENEDGTITELRNINTGSQDESLFELPSGLARAADMMEVMKEGFGEKEGAEEAVQPGGHEQMPEEMRKMIEEQMGKQNR
jgi:hypothetical protein